MKKGVKSQVTIFIIIAIIIVAGIAIFFFGLNRGKENSQTSSFDAKPIKAYLDQCVKQASEDSLYFTAIQGGYYDKPVLSKSYLNRNIPYYWNSKDKTSSVPEIKTIEVEIAKYIDNSIFSCVNNFEVFKESGYKFDSGDIKSTAKLSDKNLQVSVDYSITVSKGEETVKYDNFDISVNTKFKSAYDSANLIIEEQKKNPEYIPLSYLALLSKDKGFTFETLKLDNGEVIYTLIYDKDSQRPLVYAFVNKYELESRENSV